jgi:hypothetical protein
LVRELGANRGLCRPLGSKLKQAGDLPLLTGVAAWITKLCSHQMKTPRWEMLYQPIDCAPRLRSAVCANSSKAVRVLAAP